VVQYRWHPLYGRKVLIQSEANKCGLLRARCIVDGNSRHACIEIPRWMLDRVRCLAMRLEDAPQVSWQALGEVRAILGAADGRAADRMVEHLDTSNPFHRGAASGTSGATRQRSGTSSPCISAWVRRRRRMLRSTDSSASNQTSRGKGRNHESRETLCPGILLTRASRNPLVPHKESTISGPSGHMTRA
jgi:hypothetical protein